MDEISRVLERCVVIWPTACWQWTGPTKAGAGYGIGKVGERIRSIHRAVYEELAGPVPEGLELDHICRNRTCCNPAHLEPVTHLENIRRGRGGASKTHCPAGHEYSRENTYVSWPPRRHCRACNAARMKARRGING